MSTSHNSNPSHLPTNFHNYPNKPNSKYPTNPSSAWTKPSPPSTSPPNPSFQTSTWVCASKLLNTWGDCNTSIWGWFRSWIGLSSYWMRVGWVTWGRSWGFLKLLMRRTSMHRNLSDAWWICQSTRLKTNNNYKPFITKSPLHLSSHPPPLSKDFRSNSNNNKTKWHNKWTTSRPPSLSKRTKLMTRLIKSPLCCPANLYHRNNSRTDLPNSSLKPLVGQLIWEILQGFLRFCRGLPVGKQLI